MEHPVTTVDATQNERVVGPVLQLDIATVWTIRHGDLARVQRATGRTHAHDKLEAQVPDFIEEGSSFKAAVRQDTHAKPTFDRIGHGPEQFPGQSNRSCRPFALVHAIPNGKLQRTVFGEQDNQMNAVDVVIDAHEGQRAALLFDAGQVDTQSEQGTMFTSGSEAQRVPLRLLEAENQRLKKLVADLSLDNAMLKEVVGRKW